jgi:hypothetical protein
MHACVWMRSVLGLTACAVALLVPSRSDRAFAGDLADTLGWANSALGPGVHTDIIPNVPQAGKPTNDDFVAYINTTYHVKGMPLDQYTCESQIDKFGGYVAWGAEQKWALRYCETKVQWGRDKLKGFKTMGDVQLHPSEVEPLVKKYSEKYNVSPEMVMPMVQRLSGFRAHLISDEGHVGLMQVKPEWVGLSEQELLDPNTNVEAGVKHFYRMLALTQTWWTALVAYRVGPDKVIAQQGAPMEDGDARRFAREVFAAFLIPVKAFPKERAVESMDFVFNWLE